MNPTWANYLFKLPGAGVRRRFAYRLTSAACFRAM